MGAIRAQSQAAAQSKTGARMRTQERAGTNLPVQAIASASKQASAASVLEPTKDHEQATAAVPAADPLDQPKQAIPAPSEPKNSSEPSSSMFFVEAGSIEQFPLHLGKKVMIGNHGIAVFRTAESVFYALDDQTGHKKGGPLAEGLVSGEYVYCPLRECRIHLPTGQVQLPDTGQIGTYPVRLKDGAVLIGVVQPKAI